ncbi:MAG: thermonuclease family protein [Desulfovibrio sp.]|nr:thermonuclease family protein [Desulfovibrio sp.]
MRELLLVVTLVLLPLSAVWAWPASVMNVYDADTLTVAPCADEECPLFVRLYGIDAPALTQNDGNDARLFLAQLLPLKSQVEIIPMGLDAHGRVLALVARNGQVVNGRLVAEGHAWVESTCRAMICRKWLGLQKSAQQSAKGLWQEKEPKAPWLFDQKGTLSLEPSSQGAKNPERRPEAGQKAKQGPQWLPLESFP